MDKRQCEQCGASITLARAGARYCSGACRVRAHRAAKNRQVLPTAMADSARFVRFNAKKIPLTVTGAPASSTDPATWSPLADARRSTAGEGIGFVLGAGIGCIDLDHCIVDGELTDWAQAVLAANPATFVEVSRSGEGLHIFGLLEEAPGRKIRDGRNIEWYSAGRYIALTGNRYMNAPSSLAPLVVPV